MNITLPDTLRSLRSRNYRLFFIAQAISLTGMWMHRVAMGWLIYRLTNSSSALGIIDFAASVPVFLFTAFAGALIERWDLRKTLFVCQAACMVVALLLALLTFIDIVTFRIVLILSLILGLINAFELPCRYSLVSYMVDNKEDIPNAVALNSTNFNVARMFGPSIAGFVIHALGEGLCFMINGLAYSSTLIAIKKMRMDNLPIRGESGGTRRPIHDTIEGFRIANAFPPSRYLLILIAATGFLSFPSIVLMPAMAKSVLGGTSKTLGFLLMGVAAGALAGSLLMASLKSTRGLSRWCTRTCAAFGISVLLFSFSRSIYVGIILAAPVGFCMVTSTIACNTLIQLMAPEENKSRIMALYTLAVLGIPPFGSLLAGKMGDMFGTNWSLSICGAFCTAIALYFMSKIDKLDCQITKALEKEGAL